MTRHAVFATSTDGVSFRVGQPVAWDLAIARWYRLDDRRVAGRRLRVRFARRWYRIAYFEVREVDRHGRAEDISGKHDRSIPVAYRLCRVG